MIDARTEQLINRKLDHELTEDESLELDKQLIRFPQARSLLETQQRLEALASETLQSALSDGRPAELEAGQLQATVVRRRRTILQTGLGVAAAILLLVVVSGWPANLRPHAPSLDEPAARPGPPVSVVNLDEPAPAGVIEGPRGQMERLYRDVLGVYDEETDSFYLLEMDHTYTTVTPVVAHY